MNMNLGFLGQLQNDINTGKVQGFIEFADKGECIILDFDIEQSTSGTSQFVFWLTVPGKTDAYKKFWINIPKPDAKEAGKFLGFQRIGKTVFGCVKADPKKDRIDLVVEKIKTVLQQNSIKCAYETEVREFLSSRNGGTKQARELTALTGLGTIPKIPFTRPAPSADMRPNTTAPSYAAGFEDTVPF